MSASLARSLSIARIALITLVPLAWAAESAPVDFQREVRPILSNACFHCHGPDPNARMAGMRLDVRDGAFGKRDNGTPIVPGDPEKSLIFQRISATDPARRMPPQYAHRELTAEQIELLKRWIEQGAPWKEQWAFIAPEKFEPPAVRDTAWARNPIDRFLLARLEAEGLTPAPEADRRTLARRVSLDLTGLPPAPADVDAFVADSSSDAYEKLVDKLLASPEYGEHRARYWLDAARYGDTHGLHIDNYREIWPYRDWVIQAFNRNEPFDQFTVEQIAGDLLPNPTRDQLVATGFHRCNITTSEGGVIEEEVAVIYAKDRVDTTGAVWMGLTVGCATCHDHKFDPIKQRDFYSLAAFFRNTTQSPLDGNVFDTPPIIVVPSDSDNPRWEALGKEIPAAEAKLEQVRTAAQHDIERWLKSRNRPIGKSLNKPANGEVFRLALNQKDGMPEGVSSATTDSGLPTLAFGEEGAMEFKDAPSLSADKPFTIAVRFLLQKKDGGHVLVSRYDHGEKSAGWRLEVNGGRPALALRHDGEHEFAVRGGGDIRAEEGKWHHVVAVYDGSRQRIGVQLYLDGKLLPSEAQGTSSRMLEGDITSTEPMLVGARIDGEGQKSSFLNGSIAELQILSRPVNESEALLMSLWDGIQTAATHPGKALSERENEALTEYFLARRHRPYQNAAKQLAALRDEKRAIMLRSPITMVMKERTDTKPVAHVLNRGMYDQPREEVTPATPGFLPPMDDSLPRNRLGLARWLVDKSNPLTARVTVNRFWQEVFGTGIVRTAEDFGSQGEPPSHPELLDWLAVEFQESGWDVKKMFKLMVTSAAYRQSAAMTPEKVEKDPDNRLLSRGPQFRLDGEVIRDYALAASGLLVRKIGGPSVKPYQPPKIWETVAMNESNTRFYHPDSGDKLYRRSLYTFWKRAAPPPSMMIFNAPTREECTVRRERTNTPLQALATMNGPQFFEAARVLAEHALEKQGDFDARLDFMTARLLARRFDDREREIARNAFRDYMRFYDSHPDQAARAIAAGDSPVDTALSKPELAAFTMVANQLMNLDEVLNK